MTKQAKIPESEGEKERKPEGQGRMAALVEELAKDPRPFRELSPEERHARLEKVMGIGRGLMSTSEEFAEQKREEIEIEERRLEARVEAAWRQEVATRVAAQDAGEVETTPWEEIRDRLLARLISPEVEKISGLVPEEVNAKAEYREHALRKHR